jgi:hypothetical protein
MKRHLGGYGTILQKLWIATVAAAALAVGGCASDSTVKSSANKDAAASKYVMRYYGGPKYPMYAAARE